MSQESTEYIASPEDKGTKIKFKKPYGVKNLLISLTAIAIVSGFFSYLQAAEIMSLKSPEAKLLLPALSGFLLAIFNWKYLVKIAVILLPLWFATATAIAFAGVLLIGLLEMPYDQGTYWWLDLIIELLPPAIAGHWLYSGYSRMAKGVSFWSWFSTVFISVLIVFLLFRTELSLAIIQAFYYPLLSAALCLVHFKKEKVNKNSL